MMKHAHILVVDDDWMNREVLEGYLSMRQYRVTLAHNGASALKIIASDPPDLLMLDALLPDMSGYDICRHVRQNHATRFMPIVMVTALDSDADRLQAIEAGANDFLTKPYNSLLMLTRVKSLLEMKRLHDEVRERTDLLQRILNRYVGDLAEIILIDPDRYLKLGGETRRVSILFADISGFTSYAESRSAQAVVETLNKIFSELTPPIFEHHGTFDKYIGDELMAFFGAPVATGDDTLNAVRTAWEMQKRFRALSARLSDGATLTLEIGLHTGEAVVGNVGSERTMNYTVIGDTVNTAHRLQEIAQGGQILLSAATYEEVKDLVCVQALPAQTLPGKRTPLTIYELLSVV